MTIIGKKQREWAILKYFILSKSQNDYREIRKLFQDHSWTSEKEAMFQTCISHALTTPSKKGDMLNAYQHVWGYFKKCATVDEKKHYEYLLETYTLEKDELNPFLKQLTVTYQVPYLLQSALLFEEERVKLIEKFS